MKDILSSSLASDSDLWSDPDSNIGITVEVDHQAEVFLKGNISLPSSYNIPLKSTKKEQNDENPENVNFRNEETNKINYNSHFISRLLDVHILSSSSSSSSSSSEILLNSTDSIDMDNNDSNKIISFYIPPIRNIGPEMYYVYYDGIQSNKRAALVHTIEEADYIILSEDHFIDSTIYNKFVLPLLAEYENNTHCTKDIIIVDFADEPDKLFLSDELMKDDSSCVIAYFKRSFVKKPIPHPTILNFAEENFVLEEETITGTSIKTETKIKSNTTQDIFDLYGKNYSIPLIPLTYPVKKEALFLREDNSDIIKDIDISIMFDPYTVVYARKNTCYIVNYLLTLFQVHPYFESFIDIAANNDIRLYHPENLFNDPSQFQSYPSYAGLDAKEVENLIEEKNEKRTSEGLNTQNYTAHELQKIWVGIRGNDCSSGRKNFQKEYFHQLLRSKIVVNINPDGWEGDWRLMEALACETLVITDNMLFPGSHAHPLINNTHVLFFDLHEMLENRSTQLRDFLIYYTKPENEKERATIARQGYEYALKYHKPEDRIEEIIQIAQKLRLEKRR